MRQREAAFAAAEAAIGAQDTGLGIPGAVDDDRPTLGVAVRIIEATDPHRAAILALIVAAGDVGAFRARLRADQVGEALQEAGMPRIGAAAVRDQVPGDTAAVGVEQDEARLRRSAGEIGNGDDVGMEDLRTVAVEGGAGAGDDARVDRGIDDCLLYTSPSPRDISGSRMPSSA